jgi:hypothetical protein
MFHSRSPLLRQPEPKFQTHVQAHEAVINNERWYGNKPPDLGQGFGAAETAERRTTVMEILLRAAKRADKNEDADLAEASATRVSRMRPIPLAACCAATTTSTLP